MPKDPWTYDEDSETWLYGEPQDGCGVWFEIYGDWQAYVCYHDDVKKIGPYITKEKAQEAALEELLHMSS